MAQFRREISFHMNEMESESETEDKENEILDLDVAIDAQNEKRFDLIGRNERRNEKEDEEVLVPRKNKGLIGLSLVLDKTMPTMRTMIE